MDIVLNSHFDLHNLSEITSGYVEDIIHVPEENAIYVRSPDGTSNKLGGLLPLPAKDVTGFNFTEDGNLEITTSDGEGRSTTYNAGRIHSQVNVTGNLPEGTGIMTNSGRYKELVGKGNLSIELNQEGTAYELSSSSTPPVITEFNRILPISQVGKMETIEVDAEGYYVSRYHDPDAVAFATFEFTGVTSLNCRLKVTAHCDIGSISQIAIRSPLLNEQISPYHWLNVTGTGNASNSTQIFEVTLDKLPPDGIVEVSIHYAGTKETNIKYATSGHTRGIEPTLMTCTLETFNLDESKIVEKVDDVQFPFIEKFNEYSQANKTSSYEIEDLHYEYDDTRYLGLEDLGDKILLVPRSNNSIVIVDKATRQPSLIRLEQNWTFYAYGFTGTKLYLLAPTAKKIVRVNIETNDQLIWDTPSLAATMLNVFYVPHFDTMAVVNTANVPYVIREGRDIEYYQIPIKATDEKLGSLSNRTDISIFNDKVEYFAVATSPELDQNNIIDLPDGKKQLINRFGDKVTVSSQYHHGSYNMTRMFEIRNGLFLFQENEAQPYVIFEFAQPTEVLGFAHALAGTDQTNKNLLIWVSNDGEDYNLLFNYEIDHVAATVQNFRDRSNDKKFVNILNTPLNYKFIKVMFTKLEGRTAATHGFTFLSPIIKRDPNLRMIEHSRFELDWDIKQVQNVMYVKDKQLNKATIFDENGEVIIPDKFMEDFVIVQPNRNGFKAIERTYGSVIMDAYNENGTDKDVTGSWYFDGSNTYGTQRPWKAFDFNSDPSAVYGPGDAYRNLDMGEITPENFILIYLGNQNRKIKFDKVQYNAGIHNPRDFKVVGRDNTEYKENRHLWNVTASAQPSSSMPAHQVIKQYSQNHLNNQGSAGFVYNWGWQSDTVSSTNKPWIQVEFDKEIEISSLQYFVGPWPANHYHNWIYECSSDGITWKSLVVDQTKGYRKTGNNQESVVFFTPQMGKFIRLTVGSDKTSGLVDIGGFKFNVSEWQVLSTQLNESNLNETRVVELGQSYEFDEVGIWCDSTNSTARIVTFYEIAPIDSVKGFTREATFIEYEKGQPLKEIPLNASAYGEYTWLNEKAKSVTVNQQVGTWGAESLMDLDQASWWNANKVGPYFASFEFDEAVAPNEVYIQSPHTYYRRSGSYNYYFKGWVTWELQRSGDGNNWSTILSATVSPDGLVLSGTASGTAEDISPVMGNTPSFSNYVNDIEKSLQVVKLGASYSSKFWRIYFPDQGNSNNELVFGGMGLAINNSEMRNVGHYFNLYRKIEQLPPQAQDLDILESYKESKFVFGKFGTDCQMYSLDTSTNKYDLIKEQSTFEPELEDSISFQGDLVEPKVLSGGIFPYKHVAYQPIIDKFDSVMGYYINPGSSLYKPKKTNAVSSVQHDVDNKFNIVPFEHLQCLTYNQDDGSIVEFNNPCRWKTNPADGASVYDQWCYQSEKVNGNMYMLPNSLGPVGCIYPVGTSIDLPKFTNPTDGVESTVAFLESNMGHVIGRFVGDVPSYLYSHTVNFEMQKELANPFSCFDVKKHGVYHYNGYACFGFAGAERSWTLELNRVMNIDGFVLGVMVKSDGVVKTGVVDIRADSYHVETSMDGETWTELGSYSQSVDGAIPDTDPFYYLPTIKGTATQTKFVRVTSKRATPLDIAHGIFDLKLLTPDTQMVTTESERAINLKGVELYENNCSATVVLPNDNILVCPKDGGVWHYIDTTLGEVKVVGPCDLYNVSGDVTHAFMNEIGVLYICSIIGTIYKFDVSNNFKLIGEITTVTRTIVDSVLLENGYRFLLTTFANSEGWVLNTANDIILRKSYVGMTTGTGYFSKVLPLPGNRVLCIPDVNAEKQTFEVDVEKGTAKAVHTSIANLKFIDVAMDDRGNAFALASGKSQGALRRNMYIKGIDVDPLPPELVASKNLL